MRLVSTMVIAVLALVVAAPAAQAAGECASAPGTSAVDQYCEAIPSAEGGDPVQSGSGDKTRKPTDIRDLVPADAASELSGPDATSAGIVRLVQQSDTGTPNGDKASQGDASAGGRFAGGHDAAALAAGVTRPPSGSPLTAVVKSVQSGPTLGVLLPLTLLLAAVGIGASAWIRARRGPD